MPVSTRTLGKHVHPPPKSADTGRFYLLWRELSLYIGGITVELYKLEEINDHKYYKIPKELCENPCYRYALTSDAKIIYALLLDRMELSRKNKWVNSQGEIFLLYAKENVAEILGIAESTVYRSFKLLEQCKLVKQVRLGQNKPNQIYIGKVNYSFSIASSPQFKRTCQICRSGCVKLRGPDLSKTEASKTELSKTEFSETESYYVTLKSDDNFLGFYLSEHQKRFNKEHVRVTKDNEALIYDSVAELKEYGVDYEQWQAVVIEHFDDLPKTNNGSILPFLKASFRYFEVDLERAL